MNKEARQSKYDEVRRQLFERSDVSSGKGASREEVQSLIKLWGDLPADFERYLLEFGWLTVGSHELYGLGEGVVDFVNLLSRAPELWQGRTMYHLPKRLLPVYQGGGGWFYCISKLHADSRIVCWAYEYEELGEDQPYDIKYPSWSDWLKSYILDAPIQ